MRDADTNTEWSTSSAYGVRAPAPYTINGWDETLSFDVSDAGFGKLRVTAPGENVARATIVPNSTEAQKVVIAKAKTVNRDALVKRQKEREEFARRFERADRAARRSVNAYDDYY